MFGKRKDRQRTAKASGNNGLIPPDLRIRLVKAFMTDLPAGNSPAPPPPSATTDPPSGQYPAPPPPLRGPTQVGDFIFEITPLVGPEGPVGADSDMTIPFPGLGPVRVSQLRAAMGRLNVVAAELTGGADITDGLTPVQLQAAADRLESMRASGRLTDDQYQALAELGVALVQG